MDDLGLSALSLHEQRQLEYMELEHDDPMEIDEVDEPIEVEEVNEDDAHEDHHDSLLSILSPTTLGAKFALRPQKLLMDKPHDESQAHDYEFDTSNAVVAPKAPTTTFFTQAELGGLLGSPLPGNGPLGTGLLGTGLGLLGYAPFETDLHRSFQYRQMPLQIHHHHYYAPQETLRHRDLQVDKVRERRSLSTQSHQVIQTVPRQDLPVALPLPWDARSVPTERNSYVLSSYLQFLLNGILSAYAVHLVISMVQTVRQDVAHRMEVETANILVEIASCERSYRENNCSPETIVPALEKMCAYWEKCLQQDPTRGGNRLLVGAHTIAVLVNSLVEPLSFKVLAVAAFMLVLAFGCNFAFGYIRAVTYYGRRPLEPTALHTRINS